MRTNSCTFFSGSGWRNFFWTGGRLVICLNILSKVQKAQTKVQKQSLGLWYKPGNLGKTFCVYRHIPLGLLHFLSSPPQVLLWSLLSLSLSLHLSDGCSAFLILLEQEIKYVMKLYRRRHSIVGRNPPRAPNSRESLILENTISSAYMTRIWGCCWGHVALKKRKIRL